MIGALRALLVATSLAATPTLAGPQAVVELFTSQGCSSCPPADALLAELAARPNVIALTLPVDYWDYLGWRDTLAHPAFSARQRAYAAGRGDHQVYTPQIVVDGRIICIGSDRARVERAIAAGPDLSVEVALAEEAGRISVGLSGQPDSAGEVWLLPVARSRTVTIGRGENRGRTITYANVALGMIRLGAWTGAPTTLLHDKPLPEGADGYVVLVQSTSGNHPGGMIGAAKGGGL